MDIFSSIMLGIVQGLTEFLPISSSGHLIIARDLLGLELQNSLAFDAVLQLATTLAVLVYFWKDLRGIFFTFCRWISGMHLENKEKTMLLAVILATIPAVVLGIFLESTMETIFRSTNLVAVTLVLGALVMWLAEKFAKQTEEINAKKGFWIGCFQALALIPGMSRSGMTISGGLFLGLNREMATRFAFIMAFPILFGSGMKKLLDIGAGGLSSSAGLSLFLGSLASFSVGLLAISFLIKFLKKNTLQVFVIYRIALAIFILFVL